MNRQHDDPASSTDTPWLTLRGIWQKSKYQNLNQILLTTCIPSRVNPKTSDTHQHGADSMTDKTGRRPKDTSIYFVARFSKPFNEFVGWSKGKLQPDSDSVEGSKAGASVRFTTTEGEQILTKVAISYTDIEHTRQNMDAEAPDWNSDRVHRESTDEWNQWLSRIEVSGGAAEHQIKLYTDLWHALLGRRIISDVDGSYCDMTGAQPVIRQKKMRPDGKRPYDHYNFDALWGSQWSLNVLWSMAYPQVTDDFCNTMVDMYRDGGLIPRGPSGGNYTFVMIGDPATPFFANAYNKGIRNYDVEAAYDGLRKNAFPGGIRDHAGYEHNSIARGGGMQFYVDLGYVPEDMGGKGAHRDGAAMTLEYAYQDWCLAQFAKALGKDDDFQFFVKRSKNYKNLWNPESKLMQPKMKDGSWMPSFVPTSEGFTCRGFCESNSMIYTNFVMQDMADLVELFGGNEAYSDFLNQSFEQSVEKNFVADHGNHGILGALGVLMAVGLFQVDGGTSIKRYRA
jgi:predicted alpha-1,2-mannosidase